MTRTQNKYKYPLNQNSFDARLSTFTSLFRLLIIGVPNMYSFAGMPSTASQFFSMYASFTGTLMLFRSMFKELIPDRLRDYIYSKFNSFFFPTHSSDLTLLIDEQFGYTRNQVYEAAEIYLRTKISPAAERLKVAKTPRQKQFTVGIEKNEEIIDEFEGVKLVWRFAVSEPQNQHSSEKRYFELIFDKKFKEKVFDSYLPYVLARSKNIKDEEKVVRLYTRDCGMYDDDEGRGGGSWGSINLEHPATFDTIAMEPELKKSIKDDLERFLRRRDFYKTVGKAWKRGYLLYGPPGTGKSSLIAAMANYLKFDIYDLELTSLYSNSELRRVLLSTTNRSILVIEDIDCSVEVQDRDNADEYESSNSKFTLSGLLNFIDGLWSSCGDERIIVFTTNHKDRLDPALLRPGRMDMHIHLSYCTPSGFKLLAGNYLGIHDGNHRLCGEIDSLIESTEVTPAEIAEELMKSDDGDVALGGLVKFLKCKNVEGKEKKRKDEEEEEEEVENKKEVKRHRKRSDNNNGRTNARNGGKRGSRGKRGKQERGQ